MKSCLECENGYTDEDQMVICVFRSYIIEEPNKEAQNCDCYKHDDYSFGKEQQEKN